MFGRRGGKNGLVGLDVGSSSIKMIELASRRGSPVLKAVGSRQVPVNSIVEGQIMELNAVSEVIEAVFSEHQLKTSRVAAAVGGSSVIIKTIIVPLMSQEEMEESIEWHVEEHIPYDLADVSLDYQVVEERSEGLLVIVAACKREYVANLKQAIQLAGRLPTIVDVEAFALQNCYEFNYQPGRQELVALLSVGESQTIIDIVEGIRSVFVRDVGLGGLSLTSEISKYYGVGMEMAEGIKLGRVAPPASRGNYSEGNTAELDGLEITREVASGAASLRRLSNDFIDVLLQEIQKSFDFYRATSEHGAREEIGLILLTGGSSRLDGLPEKLAETFSARVEYLDPFRLAQHDSRQFDPDYLRDVGYVSAVAMGLALRGIQT